MTPLGIISTMQARAVAVLLSIGEARGDAQVLVALRRAAKAFSGLGLWTAPVDPLP